MTTLTIAGTRRGFRDIWPVAAFVVPFGLAFGAAAAENGISWPLATVMSASVFAGASQFAALEFWSSPVAVVPLLLVVFAVNARHILLGASLAQWLKGVPPGRRHASAALISDANEIAAPRVFVYVRPGSGWDGGRIDSPAKARAYVRWAAERGVDGFKLGSYDPPVMEALIDEARAHGLGTQAHLAQTGVAQMDALDAARLGLGSLEHWYGLPEALFDDRTIQHYPADYNYNDEYHRFAQAGRLWRQAAEPGSETWDAVMSELLELGFVLDPTLTIYEANRDVMRARNADWHERYTLPSLWQFYQPNRESHGSYWFDWTTQDEIEWKDNFRRWMRFLNEYKNRGGRVCTGSDSGFIYKLYGFDYIRELELLQEAGFHPLEVVRSATICGAQTLMEPKGETPEFGLLRPGMLADIVIVPENPLHNFKVLYGTGTTRLDENGQPVTVGGVRWTIKDGIVYDAPALLADVARMVADAKRAPATSQQP